MEYNIKKERTKERIKKLAAQCLFYNEKGIVPFKFSEKQRKCFQIEKEWVELLADSYTNRDKLVNDMEKTFGGDITFHKKLNMPKSLFAYYMRKFSYSPFVHEWIGDVFDLLSGTYSDKDSHALFEEFMHQH